MKEKFKKKKSYPNFGTLVETSKKASILLFFKGRKLLYRFVETAWNVLTVDNEKL